MKENTQENNLVEKTENTLLDKIKIFFKNLFNNKRKNVCEQENAVESKENNEFKENIKLAENSEEELLELQRKFQEGEIVEGELTNEQIDALCELYDRQIAEIQKNIDIVKQRIEDNNKRKTTKK